MGRMVGEKLGKELKTAVVVENKPGVSGIIGTDAGRLTITVNPLLWPILAASTSDRAASGASPT